jgi:peptide/nickel transport system permease protein
MAVIRAEASWPATPWLPDLSGITRVLKHRRILIGLGFLLPFIIVALLAPVLPLPSPVATSPAERFAAPSAVHPLGADALGRDSLSRIVAGAKTSLFVGFVAATAAVTIGMTLGTVAGFMGKIIDTLIMMVADIFLAFPGLLLTITMIAIFGAGLWQVILAITISDIPRTIRLQRSFVLSLKSRTYIDAARMVHATTPWLMVKHVLPHTVAPMLVVASLYVANAILTEASLSFLGLGIVPPEPSWGAIIKEGQPYLEKAWWISTLPGIAIVLISLGLHFIADGIRESLDPALRT